MGIRILKNTSAHLRPKGQRMIGIVRIILLRQKACRRGRAKASDNRQLEEIITATIKAIKIIRKSLLPSVRGGTVSVVINHIPEIASQYVVNAKYDIIQRLNVRILRSLEGALSFKTILQAQGTHQRKDPGAKVDRWVNPVVLLKVSSDII
jgi:hypothetical protein